MKPPLENSYDVCHLICADGRQLFNVQYMTEGTFNWRMMKTLFTQLHVYDEQKNYVPFDYAQEKEDPFLALQRKILPA